MRQCWLCGGRLREGEGMHVETIDVHTLCYERAAEEEAGGRNLPQWWAKQCPDISPCGDRGRIVRNPI